MCVGLFAAAVCNGIVGVGLSVFFLGLFISLSFSLSPPPSLSFSLLYLSCLGYLVLPDLLGAVVYSLISLMSCFRGVWCFFCQSGCKREEDSLTNSIGIYSIMNCVVSILAFSE